MATSPPDTFEIETRQLALLNALGRAAENLAERSRQPGIDPSERAALRNQAKLANEHAGMLLSRGTVELFNHPPGDAAKQIDEAMAGTHKTLADIQKVREALAWVGALVGVAGAVLSGDWGAVVKSLAALAKKTQRAKPGTGSRN